MASIDGVQLSSKEMNIWDAEQKLGYIQAQLSRLKITFEEDEVEMIKKRISDKMNELKEVIGGL